MYSAAATAYEHIIGECKCKSKLGKEVAYMSATAILLKTEDKPVADKFTAFIKSLSEEEKNSMLYFIEGANFARQLELQSSKNKLYPKKGHE